MRDVEIIEQKIHREFWCKVVSVLIPGVRRLLASWLGKNNIKTLFQSNFFTATYFTKV